MSVENPCPKNGNSTALPSLFRKDDRNSFCQDVKIQPESPSLNIQIVVFYFVPPFQIVETSDLSKSCYAWFYR